MKYNDLTGNEKTFYDRLTDEEKAIYLAKPDELVKFYNLVDKEKYCMQHIKQYVDISLMIIALDKRHTAYNDITDYLFSLPNNTNELQKAYDLIENASSDAFETTLTAANHSVNIWLANMDICNLYYNFLADVKIQYFNELFNYLQPGDLSQFCNGFLLKE